jgi:hypothetical protein
MKGQSSRGNHLVNDTKVGENETFVRWITSMRDPHIHRNKWTTANAKRFDKEVLKSWHNPLQHTLKFDHQKPLALIVPYGGIHAKGFRFYSI